MNEIISALERALEKAEHECPWPRPQPYDAPYLSYLAVFRMGIDYLHDTLAIFRHARKLKNQLEAERRPPKGDSDAPD